MPYFKSARKDFIQVLILIAAALFIYFPVFYTEYAYTDELVGLWQWNSGIGDSSGTLLQYGRWITGKLAELLFSSISTIRELTWIRLFSLGGWLLCIPVWFFVLKRIVDKEKLSNALPFISVLYLVCTPSFAISVGWAACFEMFLASTLGLLSGFLAYSSIRSQEDHIRVSGWYMVASIATGVLCLFTYQNCFGCFLLPFLLVLISSGKLSRKIVTGIAVYFLVYIIYYFLFKYSLKANQIDETIRTGLHINVGNKLPFFLLKPLNRAFHFTWLFNEKSIPGVIVYMLVAGSWFFISFIQQKKLNTGEKVKYFGMIFCFLVLIYLPLMVVQENFASGRTMFALSIAVFLLVAVTFLTTKLFSQKPWLYAGILSFLFGLNAWYNFNKQFLQPVAKEYNVLRTWIENNYREGTDTVFFIRPQEDFFVKKYGITRSWDEFGVPSTFFGWTPEFLVKQIVFEKTGNKKIAEKIIVKSGLDKNEFSILANVSDTLSPTVKRIIDVPRSDGDRQTSLLSPTAKMMIDVPALLNQ